MSGLLFFMFFLLPCVLFVESTRPSSFAAASTLDPIGPQEWCVTFFTDQSPDASVTFNVTRSWAPLGSDHLFLLLSNNFFASTPSAYFRVVPSFVVQWGISGSPAQNSEWENKVIPDDPVLMSNTVGTLTYATAGPNTRTTQLFMNYGDNAVLDAQGFAPLGVATSQQGVATMAGLLNPTPNNSDGVDQTLYSTEGNAWLNQTYPHQVNFIVQTRITYDCPIQQEILQTIKPRVVKKKH